MPGGGQSRASQAPTKAPATHQPIPRPEANQNPIQSLPRQTSTPPPPGPEQEVAELPNRAQESFHLSFTIIQKVLKILRLLHQLVLVPELDRCRIRDPRPHIQHVHPHRSPKRHIGQPPSGKQQRGIVSNSAPSNHSLVYLQNILRPRGLISPILHFHNHGSTLQSPHRVPLPQGNV